MRATIFKPGGTFRLVRRPFVLPHTPSFLRTRERNQRFKNKGGGRFLVSEFGSRWNENRERIGANLPRAGRGGRKGSRDCEMERTRWNSGIRSLFSYFNYLVIPPIYIMYFARRIGRRLRKPEFPIGSTPSWIPNREKGSKGCCSEGINSFRLSIVITHYSLRHSHPRTSQR